MCRHETTAHELPVFVPLNTDQHDHCSTNCGDFTSSSNRTQDELQHTYSNNSLCVAATYWSHRSVSDLILAGTWIWVTYLTCVVFHTWSSPEGRRPSNHLLHLQEFLFPFPCRGTVLSLVLSRWPLCCVCEAVVQFYPLGEQASAWLCCRVSSVQGCGFSQTVWQRMTLLFHFSLLLNCFTMRLSVFFSDTCPKPYSTVLNLTHASLSSWNI